ncbi:protein IMPACT homolog [[Candida] anglica]|uniref:Protein IMPACT homolog n=1 Tax=[Candida] anglica TaxID=148631 RepID=A0ABP0EKQ4_9ASCO
MTVEELHDEICAIDAIYPGAATELGPQIYSFKIPQHEELLVQMSFSEAYPEEKPFILQLNTTNSNRYTDLKYLEKTLQDTLDVSFHEGEVCLFDFFMELEPALEQYHFRDPPPAPEPVFDKMSEPKEISPDRYKREESVEHVDSSPEIDPFEGWFQADPIEDRGSAFYGYARSANSIEEAEAFLNQLLQDKKISRASHNMTSWRIKGERGVQYQDCDDDGEAAAGGRILHLLTMMDVWNVIVVVSRRFGGTLLGSDRFKHINTAARNAVIKAGLVEDTKKKKK